MSTGLALTLILKAVNLCLLVAAPMLVAALVIGVVVSVIQAVTQIQEQTLTFIPKLVLMAIVFILTLPWMMAHLVQYLVGVLRSLPTLVT